MLAVPPINMPPTNKQGMNICVSNETISTLVVPKIFFQARKIFEITAIQMSFTFSNWINIKSNLGTNWIVLSGSQPLVYGNQNNKKAKEDKS